ncbi:hypothetical protein ACIPY5_08975 [Microbacterium sp. NPDC089698]|uniref:hypothetical protein n=1 Tax=Microbacterium sp. NPDC089698 TaxID=3364200 RepID=UPI003805A019
MSEAEQQTELEIAFRLLLEVVTDLNQRGKVPSAAAVKSALLLRDPGFSERAVGFRRFIDFLEAAVRDGRVGVLRDPNHHPRIYPSSADIARVEAIVRSAVPNGGQDLRLRREVWRACVDWEPADYWRGWDRTTSRVFMAPKAGAEKSPWAVDPDRFLELPVVAQEHQIQWMREFAVAQSSAVSRELLLALAPDAPLGAFRQQLENLDLAGKWAVELQRNVNTHVANWATAASVSRRHLFDSGKAVDEAGSSRQAGTRGVATSARSDPRKPNPSRNESDSDLRLLLHKVIDDMTVGELSVISVPARFLAYRDH